MTPDDSRTGSAAGPGAPDVTPQDAASIADLPLEQRAPAYGALLEKLRTDLEADGRG